MKEKSKLINKNKQIKANDSFKQYSMIQHTHTHTHTHTHCFLISIKYCSKYE